MLQDFKERTTKPRMKKKQFSNLSTQSLDIELYRQSPSLFIICKELSFQWNYRGREFESETSKHAVIKDEEPSFSFKKGSKSRCFV